MAQGTLSVFKTLLCSSSDINAIDLMLKCITACIYKVYIMQFKSQTFGTLGELK